MDRLCVRGNRKKMQEKQFRQCLCYSLLCSIFSCYSASESERVVGSPVQENDELITGRCRGLSVISLAILELKV